MVLISETILLTRNARDKVQLAIVKLSQDGNIFYIHRFTGQLGGKFTEQPELSIDKGKVKRSVLQQAQLEYDSIINKYLDKGYKKLSSYTDKSFEKLSEEELNNFVPKLKTDQHGNVKPMLAKKSEECTNSVLNKTYYASRKLNGVRMNMGFKEEPFTVSRGGKNYNNSTKHIQEELYPYLSANPHILLDGELYIHGLHLQTISGLARQETFKPECEKLEYWIYDIAIPDVPFTERLETLNYLRERFKNLKHVKVLEHVLSKSWASTLKYHDMWVEEGFEGAVLRHPDKEYQFGKRNSSMIKVKLYQDDEFTIIGKSDGLRPEDFCFLMQTKDGKIFEAKPCGTREQKAEYIRDIESLKGKKGTVKFFEYSKDGIPLQTTFQAVRDYE